MSSDDLNSEEFKEILKNQRLVRRQVRDNREKAQKKVRITGAGFVGRTLEPKDVQRALIKKTGAKSFFGKSELVSFDPSQIKAFERVIKSRQKKLGLKGLTLDDLIVISQPSPTFGTVMYTDDLNYKSKTKTVRVSGRRVYSIKRKNVIQSAKRLPAPKFRAYKLFNDRMQLIFNQRSETGRTSHIVKIDLRGFFESLSNTALIRNKANRLNYAENVKDAFFNQFIGVSCTCSSWRYWFAYKATKFNYNSGAAERGFPKERNQKLEGGTCKHVINALVYMRINSNLIDTIEKEMAKIAEKTVNSLRTKFLKDEEVDAVNKEFIDKREINNVLRVIRNKGKAEKKLSEGEKVKQQLEKSKKLSKQIRSKPTKELKVDFELVVRNLREQGFNDQTIANVTNQSIQVVESVK